MAHGQQGRWRRVHRARSVHLDPMRPPRPCYRAATKQHGPPDTGATKRHDEQPARQGGERGYRAAGQQTRRRGRTRPYPTTQADRRDGGTGAIAGRTATARWAGGAVRQSERETGADLGAEYPDRPGDKKRDRPIHDRSSAVDGETLRSILSRQKSACSAWDAMFNPDRPSRGELTVTVSQRSVITYPGVSDSSATCCQNSSCGIPLPCLIRSAASSRS